jgi:hypothetical protein
MKNKTKITTKKNINELKHKQINSINYSNNNIKTIN